jgi:hypothetical protein
LQDLIDLTRRDVDASDKRVHLARYVGLEVPAQVPLGARTLPEAVASKYGAKLAKRMADPAALAENLTGVDNLKAQLYGIEGVTANASKIGRAADAAAAQ